LLRIEARRWPLWALLLVLFCALCASAVRAQGALQAGGVTLRISPSPAIVAKGEVFTVTVAIEAGGQAVQGAQASLDYDPAVLQVQAITPGTALPLPLLSRYDNAAGTLDCAYGQLQGFAQGTFALASIRLRAIARSKGSALAFHRGLPRDTDVAFDGKSVLGQAIDGLVMVGTYNSFLPLLMRG
jgi:hypothetical protein